MTVRTRAQINSDADTLLPDNTSAEISPADLRGRVKDLADSALMAEDVGTSAGKLVALDGSGKIAAAVLPSFVDDVLEFANLAAFPGTGETGKIYVTLDTNKTYRWSGSAYVEISPSPGSTDVVTEGATNKYYTDTRVRAAVLTGISLLTNAAITAADTVLSAMGKLQKQITDLTTSVSALTALPRREVLVAARTYYVSTTGSDSADGLTVGTPFLTIQKAVDVAASLDLVIYQVSIQLADGTYTAGVVLKSYVGALAPIIKGNNANPQNVIISTTAAICFSNTSGRDWQISDLSTQSTGTGNHLYGGNIKFSNLRFGNSPEYHIFANGGLIQANGNYSIVGGAQFHYACVSGSIVCSGRTVTVTGTPAFSGAFALAGRGGVLESFSTTYSGSATGSRYNANANGVIFTNGGGANYFPGNAVGTTATGGQYV